MIWQDLENIATLAECLQKSMFLTPCIIRGNALRLTRVKDIMG